MRRLSDLCLYLYGYYIYRYVLYSLEHDRRRNTNQRSSGSFTWYNKVYILSSPVCCMLGGEQTSLPVCSLPRVCWYQLLAYVSSKDNICLWAAHRVLLHFWCVYPPVWFMTVAVECSLVCVPRVQRDKESRKVHVLRRVPATCSNWEKAWSWITKKDCGTKYRWEFFPLSVHHSSHLQTCENSSFDPSVFSFFYFSFYF